MAFFNWAAPLFGRFGDRWSDTTIESYRRMLAAHVAEGGRVLDVGGGTGALARRLSDALGCDVVVLDPTQEMVAQMAPHPRVTAVLGSAEAMPFGDGEFDAVVVSDAFHHFRDQPGAAREMARVVRPGGAVLVLEFDRTGLMRLIVWGEKLLGEPGAFFTPEEACAFFADHGIQGTCERVSSWQYWFLGEVRRGAA